MTPSNAMPGAWHNKGGFMGNVCFIDSSPQTKIGTSRNRQIGSWYFTEQYLAAHIHPDGHKGIYATKNVQECSRHANLYGGSVMYGWVSDRGSWEQDLSNF